MLQMRAAAAGIRDDCVKLFGWELVDLFDARVVARVPIRRCGHAREPQQICSRRSDHFATVMRQHFGGITVDVTEDEVLCATRQQRNPVSLRAAGGLTGGISSDENFGWMSGVMASNS